MLLIKPKNKKRDRYSKRAKYTRKLHTGQPIKKHLRNEIQKQIKYSHDTYVNDIMILGGITPDHFQLKFIFNLEGLVLPEVSWVRDDWCPPHPPLPQNNRIHTLDSSKTEALREQFDTAFTDEDFSSIPSPRISPCDSMPNIHISLQGVKKQQ